ncbi:MAG: hypothetical protein AABY07_02560 [Nanoarchaeota archaeon]
MKEDLEKNLYDLKHDLNLTKAGTFLGLAFTSWIVVFFSTQEFFDSKSLSLALSTVVSIIFLTMAIIMFNRCDEIYNKIERMKEN